MAKKFKMLRLFWCWEKNKKIQKCLYIVSDDSLNTAYSIYQHLNCEHILTQGVHFQYFISQKYSHMFTKIYIYIYIWMIIWIYNFLKVEENIHQYRKSKEMGKWLRRKETKLWGSYPVTYWVCKTHSGF